MSAFATGFSVVASFVLSCSSFGSSTEATGDGGADGGTAPSARFCPSHKEALLCDDFDDPGRAAWGTSNIEPGGMLGASDASAFSPPRALLVASVLPADCISVYQSANALERVAAPNGFHLEFKLRPPAELPLDVAIGPSVVTSGPNAQKCEYFLTIGPGSKTLSQEHDPPTKTTDLAVDRVLASGWNAISIDVEGQAPARTVTVRVNGELSIDKHLVDDICQTADLITASNGGGLFCVTSLASGNVQVSFDDLLLSVRP